MGDRCYIYGQVLKRDWPPFCAFLGVDDSVREPDDDYANSVAFSFSEANYAWFTELHGASQAGLTFVVYNDAGGSYGIGVVISIGGRFFPCETNNEREVCVPLQEDGTIADGAMERARAALRAEQECRRLLKREDPDGAV